jgi:hypothetical protein
VNCSLRLLRCKRCDALDLDQHLRIGQRLDHAGGAGGVGRGSERRCVQHVHGGDIGRARQQHVDLDQIAEGDAGPVEHALDIADDETELRLEPLRQRAVIVKAGNARDKQEIAGAGRKGQRRGLDVGGRREVLNRRGSPLSLRRGGRWPKRAMLATLCKGRIDPPRSNNPQ